jgi:aerobic carbon-monoxide dehydrogenase small subunit
MRRQVTLKVNGRTVTAEVEPRWPLAELLRDHLRLTGTHVGCDTSQCGACTVHVDGVAVRSCTLLAVQADGADVTTIEGIARDGALHPLQQAFQDAHALQCGFCTPGMIMSALDMFRREQLLSEELIAHNLDGNICRCTGYYNVIKAIASYARSLGRYSPTASGS